MMKYFISTIFILYCLKTYGVEAQCGDLYLTVSAVDSKLELNWDFTRNCNGNPPDTLTLFHQDQASGSPRQDIQSISVRSSPEGYHKSEEVFGTPSYPGNWNENDANPVLSSHCFPYWLESVRDGQVVDTVCIKIEPAWMQNFGGLRVTDMFIPGTHDSGAWTGFAIDLAARYTWTQDFNLWGQLVSGIRYLDVRVGIHPKESPIEWINHGLVRCTPMEEELTHVANFLRKSPNEVVFLHFNTFETPSEFTTAEHDIVLNLVQRVLGEFIVPRAEATSHGQGPTLQDLWNSGKRLVVIYNDQATAAANNWLWYHTSHKWGDKQTALDLYNYMRDAKNGHAHQPTPFCVLTAVLTPDIEYIIRHLDGSLRYMADEVNPYFNSWIVGEGWEDDINIIATDFFRGNNLIDVAIKTNTRRLQGRI